MKFLCLVYHDEAILDAMSPTEMSECTEESQAYDALLERRGQLVLAHALQSVRHSRSVRRRAGENLVTDGPFAETKEQLIGFVLVEAADHDEAMEIGSRIPLGRTGTIEVRPILDI